MLAEMAEDANQQGKEVDALRASLLKVQQLSLGRDARCQMLQDLLLLFSEAHSKYSKQMRAVNAGAVEQVQHMHNAIVKAKEQLKSTRERLANCSGDRELLKRDLAQIDVFVDSMEADERERADELGALQARLDEENAKGADMAEMLAQLERRLQLSQGANKELVGLVGEFRHSGLFGRMKKAWFNRLSAGEDLAPDGRVWKNVALSGGAKKEKKKSKKKSTNKKKKKSKKKSKKRKSRR